MAIHEVIEATYEGSREELGASVVSVTEHDVKRELDPRLDLANHSPAGFEWGYQGSGPAQLALAILADALDDNRAIGLHQQFKREFVANWTMGTPWSIKRSQVVAWANKHGIEQVVME